jgi:uncharacterized protein YoxC
MSGRLEADMTTPVWIIAVCQIVLVVGGLIAALALAYLVISLKKLVNQKVDDAMNRVQPIVEQAKSIAEQAKDTAEKVSEKVDTMVTRAETAVDRVGDQVESVSAKVEQAMNPQVLAVAGIVGTAVKCAQIYKDIAAAKQSGDGGQESEEL